MGIVEKNFPLEKGTNSKDSCIFCHSNDSTFLYPTKDIFGKEWEIRFCNNCSAHYLSRHPSDEELDKAYDITYYGESEKKFDFPIVDYILGTFSRLRARRLSKYLVDGNRILDIGCGNGSFLKNLLRYGNYELHGTELQGNSAERAKKIPEINLQIGFVIEQEYEHEYFDAITLTHVFEHLRRPKETLIKINAILKNKGCLMITVPNIDSFQSKLFKGKWLHLDPPRHLSYFKPNDFETLMKEYGFTLVRKHFVSPDQNPYGFYQSILNSIFKKRELLYEHLKGNKEYTQGHSSVSILIQKGFLFLTYPIFVLSDLIESAFGKGASVEYQFIKTSKLQHK